MDRNPDQSRPPSESPPGRGVVHAIALLTTAFTWPLLFVGGLVTTYRVGVAVPDWPTTFGINMFVYRFWNAPWGVFIEHTHRLLGTGAGIGCLILAAWSTAAAGRSAWKPAAIAILGASAGSAVGIASTSDGPLPDRDRDARRGGEFAFALVCLRRSIDVRRPRLAGADRGDLARCPRRVSRPDELDGSRRPARVHRPGVFCVDDGHLRRHRQPVDWSRSPGSGGGGV